MLETFYMLGEADGISRRQYSPSPPPPPPSPPPLSSELIV